MTEAEWRPLLPRLHALWADGLSTAKIGVVLGISKNAVIGKAHREGLKSRPSPLTPRREGVPPRPTYQKRKAAGAIAATRVSATALVATVVKAEPSARLPVPAPLPIPIVDTPPEPDPPASAPVIRHRTPAFQACKFPFGEPRTPGFHYCGKDSLPGEVYCQSCYDRAYIRRSVSKAAEAA